MQHEAILRGKVRELRWRVRLLVTQRWVFLGLFCACIACIALVIANKLHWLPAPPEWLAAILLTGAAVGAIVGLTRRVTAMDAAQLADRRLDLRERLSSGLDFINRGEGDPMVAAQVADAAKCSAQLRAAEVFPHRFPRGARLFVAGVIVLLAAIYVPELAVFQTPQKQAERAALGREGAKLQALAKEPGRRRADRGAEIERRVLQQMQNLGKDMKRGQVSKKQAMLRMDRLTREIQKEQQQLALANSPKPLDRAAEQMKQSAEAMKQQGNSDAAKTLAEMANALEKKDLEAAAQQLKQLAEKLQSGKMSEAEAKAAAGTLSKMAAAMKGTELEQTAKQLEQAGKSLKQISQMPSGPQKEAAMQKLQQQAGKCAGAASGTCSSCAQQRQSADSLEQMAQALQAAQGEMARAGGDTASLPQEMSGKDGFKSDGSAGGGKPGGSGSGSGAGGALGGPGRGVGGKIPPVGAPTPGKKIDTLIPGQKGQGEQLIIPYRGTPDRADPRAAWYETYPSARRAAEDALNKEHIPPGHQQQVKEYFEAIQPQGK